MANGDRPSVRLTFRQIYESKGTNEYPVWAGARIAFVNEDEGRFTVRSVLASGAAPRTVSGPYDVEVRALQTDGRRLIYEKGFGLEIADLVAGKAFPVSFDLRSDLIHTRPFRVNAADFVQGVRIGPTGKRVLVESRGQIVSLPASEGEARVILARPGVRFRVPAVSHDGLRLAFISDETGEQQLWVSGPNGESPMQLTKDVNRQLRTVRWSPDGKWIALGGGDMRLRLVAPPPPAPEASESRLVGKEGVGGGGSRASAPSPGPQSSSMEPGQTPTSPQRGEVRFIGGVGNNWMPPDFDFSPDSKWIAYERWDHFTFFRTLVLHEIATGKETVLGRSMSDDFSPRFSPDGKWLGFLTTRRFSPLWDSIQNLLFTNDATIVCLLGLRADTPSPFAPKNDEEPVGEPKKPEEKTEPLRINLDGLYGRMVEVPFPPGVYGSLGFSGDRVLAIQGRDDDRALVYYDLKAKSFGTLAKTTQYQISDDRKKLLVGAGNAIRVIDATAKDVSATEGRVAFGNLQLQIHAEAEWKQMFWDAWRLIRDYFYVANLHGADWRAVGARYAAMLPSVRSRDELDELIRWMQAELGISHSFLSPGDQRSLLRPSQAAFLGMDVEPSPSGYYRIKKILRGDGNRESERSPLAGPGLNVKEGDYLIEVAGIPARVGSDWQAGIQGRAGQVVSVKVSSGTTVEKTPAESSPGVSPGLPDPRTGQSASPDPKTVRTYFVKPIPSERRLRYLDWVETNRAYVENASGGRLAYIHISAMVTSNFADFVKQYFPQRGREGLVMDVRFNTGGNISDQVITILKQKLQILWNQREVPGFWTRQSDFFPGPMVCLINEFNYSDGEEFPYQWRMMELGKLIGRRTRGGEVGSDPGWPLADGGVVSVPNYGAWTPEEGWIIEGPGVSPDLDVPSDPNLFVKGVDPQLDSAISELLDSLKRHPVKRPVQPPDPVRVRGGGRGDEAMRR